MGEVVDLYYKKNNRCFPGLSKRQVLNWLEEGKQGAETYREWFGSPVKAFVHGFANHIASVRNPTTENLTEKERYDHMMVMIVSIGMLLTLAANMHKELKLGIVINKLGAERDSYCDKSSGVHNINNKWLLKRWLPTVEVMYTNLACRDIPLHVVNRLEWLGHRYTLGVPSKQLIKILRDFAEEACLSRKPRDIKTQAVAAQIMKRQTRHLKGRRHQANTPHPYSSSKEELCRFGLSAGRQCKKHRNPALQQEARFRITQMPSGKMDCLAA